MEVDIGLLGLLIVLISMRRHCSMTKSEVPHLTQR
jgi:hypothetical protein